jgi:hypothetical protein
MFIDINFKKVRNHFITFKTPFSLSKGLYNLKIIVGVNKYLIANAKT